MVIKVVTRIRVCFPHTNRSRRMFMWRKVSFEFNTSWNSPRSRPSDLEASVGSSSLQLSALDGD